MALRLTVDAAPNPDDVQAVWQGLNAYNRTFAGDEQVGRLAVLLRDEQGEIVAGLLGVTYWGWLSIEALWVAESLRGQGQGRTLVAAAEQEAVRRGCRYAQVDTMDFQAPPFYLKLGYRLFGELHDLPAGTGHRRYWLFKPLDAPGTRPVAAPGATNRTPITYMVDGQKVFGVVHRPAVATMLPRPAVLILHGLVASKEQPHQIFVKLAEALARAGFVALRIDLRGRGDSEGDMAADVTPEGDLLDARRALDWLAGQPDVDAGRLAVVGLSWGGTLAALLAARDERVRAIALWNPALAMLGWRPPLADVDGGPVFEMFGNLIGRQFFEGLDGVDPLRDLESARGPVLVVQSEADDAAGGDGAAAANRLALALAGAGVEHRVVLIPGADHGLMCYEWERQAIDQTVEWLAGLG